MIIIDIDLTKIPNESVRRYTRRNQEEAAGVHLSIVRMKQPDEYKNTHTVFIAQTPDERTNKNAKIYVGKGIEYEFRDSSTRGNYAPSEPKQADDDPF
ncbi:MAG: hypothetical protein RSF40_04945 [Oscillospiraceae bacterium]